MDENNSKLPLDLTEVANKTYDDLASKPFKSTGNAGSTIIDFLHNFILYPLQKYNIYATQKLKKYEEEVINRANKIPNSHLTYPRINILGPTIEGLKYNLNEDYIKECFTNILIADMDNRKQDKVLPSYIGIVNELSRNDAKMLKFFKKNDIHIAPILKFKYIFDSGGFVYPTNNLALLYNEEDIVLEAVVLDNLCRLKLIELTFDEKLFDSTIYSNAFKKIKLLDEFKLLPNNVKELSYVEGLLKITSFGENFIDICLS